MKKVKSAIAFLCACVALCAPLTACAKTPSATLSSSSSSSERDESLLLPDSSVEQPSSSLDDATSSSEEQSTPPTSSSSSDQTSSSTTPSLPVPDDTPAKREISYIRCTGDSVNLRAGAGKNFDVVGSAKKGTMYAIIEKKGDWYKIYYRNKEVYISASYATLITMEKADDDRVEEVLLEGYKLLGVPYVYGAVRYHDGKGTLLKGFSVQKFDCSSLVQYVFYRGAKKLLNTTTRTQVKQGKYVSKANLRRGDCIYFTNEERQYKTGIERVGHVAIYLGNDYILHTSSDYARIEKMSATRWKFYIEARRFV